MLIRVGQRSLCSSGKGGVLAEPWGSPNNPLKDGPSSLLATRLGGMAQGRGHICPSRGRYAVLMSPNLWASQNLPSFSAPPPPRSQHDCMMPPAAPRSAGIFRNYTYICTRRGRAAPGAYIYIYILCWMQPGGAAGPGTGGSPAAERAHDTHSHRARERGQGTMRRGWGRWRGRQRGRGGCTPRQAHTQSYLGAMNTCPSDSKLLGSRYSKSATEREGYPAGSGDGGAGGQEGERRTERARERGGNNNNKKKPIKKKGICCSW